jgi:hypothetical protein
MTMLRLSGVYRDDRGETRVVFLPEYANYSLGEDSSRNSCEVPNLIVEPPVSTREFTHLDDDIIGHLRRAQAPR